MEVKRAHMVSRGYLRGWQNDRNAVHVWDLEHRRTTVQCVGNATVVSYAYRTEHVNHDLEAEYGQIESDGTPALRVLADGGQLTSNGEEAVIRFLDMHLERGRYADQATVSVPVVAGGLGVDPHVVQMGLGDRLTLSRDVDKETVRIASLGLRAWPWSTVEIASGIGTGDGAVMPWRTHAGAPVSTVTFPLSHTRLLVIGKPLDLRTIDLNGAIVYYSRRWIVDHVSGRLARGLTFA